MASGVPGSEDDESPAMRQALRNLAILVPMFALAAWTAIILLAVPAVRLRAALRRQVKADDFRYGESPDVPGQVALPNASSPIGELPTSAASAA